MSIPESRQKRPNPYYPAFDLLLAKLLAAEQTLSVSEAVFCHASEMENEWLPRIPEREMPGMMADICDHRIPDCVKYIPSLRMSEQETHYLMRAVRDFRIQSYLWAITRAFEAFREFVESIENDLLSAVDTDADRKPPASNGGTKQKTSSRFIRALKRIRQTAPSLVDCETKNTRKIELQQWIRVAEKVRDAVAHNEGVLRAAVYEKYRTSNLERHFPGELEPGIGYVLKPTPENVTKTIRTLREYGVAIYKAISGAKGFPASLVGKDGEITTWQR